MRIAEFYYVEGGLAFGLVVAVGLAVISSNPTFAGLCAWAAAVLFVSIGIVWGITTIEPAWVRILAVGIVGLAAAIGLTESLRFLKGNQSDDVNPPKVETSGPRPTFEATNRSKILAKDASIAGTIPFPLAKADTDSMVDMSGMLWISADAPTTFPNPTGEFSKLSNTELRNEAREVCQQLREFQALYDADRNSIAQSGNTREELESHSKQTREVFSKYSQQYQSKFPAMTKSLASELLYRTKGLSGDSISQDANIGAHVILQGKFSGGKPASSSADFLDAIASRLPE